MPDLRKGLAVATDNDMELPLTSLPDTMIGLIVYVGPADDEGET